MKHNYNEMTTSQILRLYDECFFPPFPIQWDDDIENHRQEIIDCIEYDEPKRAGSIRLRAKTAVTATT